MEYNSFPICLMQMSHKTDNRNSLTLSSFANYILSVVSDPSRSQNICITSEIVICLIMYVK